MSGARLTQLVMEGHERAKQRTGQYLFNYLPVEIGNIVAGTIFDPFHRDWSREQIKSWIAEHLIFADDGVTIVGLFDGNTILWEKEK